MKWKQVSVLILALVFFSLTSSVAFAVQFTPEESLAQSFKDLVSQVPYMKQFVDPMPTVTGEEIRADNTAHLETDWSILQVYPSTAYSLSSEMNFTQQLTVCNKAEDGGYLFLDYWFNKPLEYSSLKRTTFTNSSTLFNDQLTTCETVGSFPNNKTACTVKDNWVSRLVYNKTTEDVSPTNQMYKWGDDYHYVNQHGDLFESGECKTYSLNYKPSDYQNKWNLRVSGSKTDDWSCIQDETCAYSDTLDPMYTANEMVINQTTCTALNNLGAPNNIYGQSFIFNATAGKTFITGFEWGFINSSTAGTQITAGSTLTARLHWNETTTNSTVLFSTDVTSQLQQAAAGSACSAVVIKNVSVNWGALNQSGNYTVTIELRGEGGATQLWSVENTSNPYANGKCFSCGGIPNVFSAGSDFTFRIYAATVNPNATVNNETWTNGWETGLMNFTINVSIDKSLFNNITTANFSYNGTVYNELSMTNTSGGNWTQFTVAVRAPLIVYNTTSFNFNWSFTERGNFSTIAMINSSNRTNTVLWGYWVNNVTWTSSVGQGASNTWYFNLSKMVNDAVPFIHNVTLEYNGTNQTPNATLVLNATSYEDYVFTMTSPLVGATTQTVNFTVWHNMNFSPNTVNRNNITSTTLSNGTQKITGTCGSTITTNTTYGAGFSCTAGFITIGSNNTVIDCAGNTIVYNTAGGNNVAGIDLLDLTNVTVKNCILTDGNAGGSATTGIRLLRVSNSNILNNTVTGFGTTAVKALTVSGSAGLAENNTITNNTLSVFGSTASNVLSNALQISTNMNYNNFTGNNLTSSNDSTILFVGSPFNNNRFTDNTVTATGNQQHYGGLHFQSVASYNGTLFFNTTINVTGGGNNSGILLRFGSTLDNSTFNYTSITSQNLESFGINSHNASVGLTFDNTFINYSQTWLNMTASLTTVFTNTTFQTPNGSIRFALNFTPSTTVIVNNSVMTVVNNSAFINSTRVPWLNTSAQVTFLGIVVLNPVVTVDFDDNGTFILCPTSVCTTVSFSGTTLVFNVTHWTNYSTGNATASLVYSGNVSNGTYNFVRYLTTTINFTCVTNATFIRNINGVLNTSYPVACTNATTTFTNVYLHPTEGNFTINWTLLISGVVTISTNDTPFISDLLNPVVSQLNITTNSTSFNGSTIYNVSMTCTDTMYSPLNYTLTLNSALIFNGTKPNNTQQLNQTSITGGVIILTAVCGDQFGFSTLTLNVTFFSKILALIDEVNNIPLDVSNLTSVRVYQDDNSTYFDFKLANVSTINFTTINNTQLRFELIYASGAVITRWIDVSLLNDTTLRVCGNLEGVIHYEQLITSTLVQPVTLRSLFANCYVAADYTRFAFQDRHVLKAFTIHRSYVLSTVITSGSNSGNQVLIAGIDGSIPSEINLDVLALIANPYDFTILQSALTFRHIDGTNTTLVVYVNSANNNVNGTLVLTDITNNMVLLNTSAFTNPNNWSMVVDFTTFNLSNSTVFQLVYTSTTTEGLLKTVKTYFTGRGSSGVILNGVAAVIAIFFLLFGLSVTSARTTFSWFGILICLATFIILTKAVGGVWYITFLQGMTMIVLCYIVINLVKQGGDTLT